MSITSGPVLPDNTGKLTDGEPSEKLRVAVRSVMGCGLQGTVVELAKTGERSGGAQLRDEGCHGNIGRLRASGDEIPQVVVGKLEQCIEHPDFVLGDRVAALLEEARQHEVVLQHAPP